MSADASSSDTISTQQPPSDDTKDAKNRTLKVTMAGGLWTTDMMLETFIPDPSLRDLATSFADGRNGETNVFFVSFPTTEMAQVILDSSAGEHLASLVTDPEFEVFEVIYKSAVVAAASGYTLPRLSVEDCSSKNASPPEPEATSARSLHQETSSESETEGYQTNSINPPLGTPHKRRRTSPRGPDVTSPTISPAQGLRNLVGSFAWTLGMEFAAIPAPPAPNVQERSDSATAGADGERKEDGDEGGSTVVLSAKAKGKRPAK
ncbi:hypothetical protein FS837_004362 [Tulasnella sp. UAMH 9824]|nr:hypothetical protein FS837_004362 [Tulasnella sp. UAMH 9824]